MYDLPENYCYLTKYYKPLLSCLKCKKYPCPGLSREKIQALENSPFVRVSEESKLFMRRKRMYIFKKEDGSLQEADPGFDLANPDFNRLLDVKEVLCVNKIFEKQLRLVAKSKEERAAILANLEDQPTPPEPQKRTRGTKK